jgi:hypothetical protein
MPAHFREKDAALQQALDRKFLLGEGERVLADPGPPHHGHGQLETRKGILQKTNFVVANT